MDAKLFKAFTPFINVVGDKREETDFSKCDKVPAADPGLTQWRHLGFREFDDMEYWMDVQGAGEIVCVEIAERILPGSVIKDKMRDYIADLTVRTGRKPGKKEFAEIKEEVIMALLPTAFIKRKLIPVLFTKNQVLVFTGSAKTCDDVIALLTHTLNDADVFSPARLDFLVAQIPSGVMTAMAKQGLAESDSTTEQNEISTLLPTNNLVLKGEGKQTIRVKDKDIDSHDIANLLKQSYDVVSIGVEHMPLGGIEPDCAFTLSDKLVFTGFKLPEVAKVRGTSGKDDEDTFLSTAWLTSIAARGAVDTVVAVCGGLNLLEASATAVEEDPDEL